MANGQLRANEQMLIRRSFKASGPAVGFAGNQTSGNEKIQNYLSSNVKTNASWRQGSSSPDERVLTDINGNQILPEHFIQESQPPRNGKAFQNVKIGLRYTPFFEMQKQEQADLELVKQATNQLRKELKLNQRRTREL